ncbi:MAG: sensor domain-containing diguanylate cyclase [Thermoleophilia bacterium]|nr:sensor domain-containing diguanylate cyclase [Thermoleophilia bacterium]MDH4341214.1 sensor domain-containing diguanylate cyclase [Thermoleophilia bacterium]MDH5281360.1 sensor domain-containing diguanylate cyclase [Thermoleophilia bacterium]
MEVAPLPFGQSATDFELASKKALAYLHDNLGMGLWMVTRVVGDDWIVLTSEDHGYDVSPGDVFAWSDSFCSRMVRGLGPRVAPVSEDVPAYRDAPIGRQVPIGAYVGVPLLASDGELFGTLCAIDPLPQQGLEPDALPLAELLGDFLSGILALELRVAETERVAERALRELTIDELTGLFNRRGWEGLLAAEEDRCRRHGSPAAVVLIDVDGLKAVNDSGGHTAGDDLLRRCAEAMTTAVRGHDVAARLGGDEFAVLAVECDEAGGAELAARLADAFGSAEIAASIGLAVRKPASGLPGAVLEADACMYEAKRARYEDAAQRSA